MNAFIIQLATFLLKNNKFFINVIEENDAYEKELNETQVEDKESSGGDFLVSSANFLGSMFIKDWPRSNEPKPKPHKERYTSFYRETIRNMYFGDERTFAFSSYGLTNLIFILEYILNKKYGLECLLNIKNISDKQFLSLMASNNKDLLEKSNCCFSSNNFLFYDKRYRIKLDICQTLEKAINVEIHPLDFNDFDICNYKYKNVLYKYIGNLLTSNFKSDFFSKKMILVNTTKFHGYWNHVLSGSWCYKKEFETPLDNKMVLTWTDRNFYKLYSNDKVNVLEMEFFDKQKTFSFLLVQMIMEPDMDYINDNSDTIIFEALDHFKNCEYTMVDLQVPKIDVNYVSEAGDLCHKLKRLNSKNKNDSSILDTREEITMRQYSDFDMSRYGINVRDPYNLQSSKYDKYDERFKPIPVPTEKDYEEIQKNIEQVNSKAKNYDDSVTYVTFNRSFYGFLVDKRKGDGMKAINPTILMTIKYIGPDVDMII